MVPEYIKKLINAHIQDRERINFIKSLRHVSVSKVASLAAGTYESVRNSVELEQEHLLRRRAIRRIMIRMGSLKGGDPVDHAEDLVKEIIWSKYTKKLPVPEMTIEEIGRILQKYQVLVGLFQNRTGKKLGHKYAEDLYDIISFEIERALSPYKVKDALVNLQYFYLLPLRLIKNPNLPEKFETVQTYLTVLRTLTKFDNSIIRYYMFRNAFSFWSKPSKDDMNIVISRLEKTLDDIDLQLTYKISNRKNKEFIRQSIPLKILDNVIETNIENAEDVVGNKEKRDIQIEFECNKEYKQLRSKITKQIIKMVIYLAMTKMVFAFIVEVPYELWINGGIENYTPLLINILFPPVLMFIIASSFQIPMKRNTMGIIEMVDRIMDPATMKFKNYGLVRDRKRPFLHFLFKVLYYTVFFIVLGIITFALYEFLDFGFVSIGIFILFLSVISFGALKVRNTATEIVVVPMGGSLFAPLVDIVATPIVGLGKKLTEGVSKISPLPFIMDFIIESPYKAILWVFEEWNSYIKEQREEIV